MRRGMALFLFVVIFMLNGCALMSQKQSTGASDLIEPQIRSRFADVPVPTGFRLLSRDSYSFESTGTRVGLLKYQGKADVEQVAVFYKEQMPLYKWNLLNIVEYGEHLLNFDRDYETCVVNLIPKGRSTVVTIAVGPKSQALPKKAEKPIK